MDRGHEQVQLVRIIRDEQGRQIVRECDPVKRVGLAVVQAARWAEPEPLCTPSCSVKRQTVKKNEQDRSLHTALSDSLRNIDEPFLARHL